jgi:hypothetical protein
MANLGGKRSLGDPAAGHQSAYGAAVDLFNQTGAMSGFFRYLRLIRTSHWGQATSSEKPAPSSLMVVFLTRETCLALNAVGLRVRVGLGLIYVNTPGVLILLTRSHRSRPD